MFNKKSLTLASVIAATTLTMACSHEPKQADDESVVKTSQAAAEVGASKYTVVSFEQGQNSLPESEKTKLRELVSTAQKSGRDVEIQVLAWADKEYPAKGQDAASRDVSLADQRADNIKDFLKQDLKTSADVDTHNMAKRPGFFSEMVKSQDFETKTTFENTGAAPNDAGPRSALLGNKASKAVILVKYE